MYITGVGFGFIVGIVIFGILDSTHLLTGPRLHRSSPEQSPRMIAQRRRHALYRDGLLNARDKDHPQFITCVELIILSIPMMTLLPRFVLSP